MSQWKKPRSVVAWQSKAEWDQVMVGLYCGDCQMQRDALDRVSAWKSRYGHRMPLAVESTADLIRCKILDAKGGLKSHELVLTYGLALVRFVNLITERKQKTFIISLRRLAKELNLPVWIVNLRHNLTHGTLPQLVACRRGCDVVLEWLHHTYWSRQLGNDLVGECADEEREELLSADTEMGTDSSLEEAEKSQSPGNQKHQELHEKVTDVLVSYKNQQIGVLQQLQDVEETCKVWCSSSSEVEWIVAQMKDLLQENREIVAGALLGSGFLLPTAEELQILNINYRETKEWDFRIPQTFLRFWQPLLKGLHSKGFTQTLLENMFRELKQHTQGPELRSWYLISWITEILKANMQAKKKPKNSSRKRRSSSKLFLRRVPLQWLKLLDTCLEAPCGASPHLLHLLLSGMEPPLPAETQEKLLYLTSIYTQEDSALLSPNCATDLRKQPIYTVESLQRRARPSGGVRGPDRRVGKQEALSTDRAEGVEEEMATQPGPRLEPCPPESAVALAEKRVALQGAAWQVSSEGVKWKNLPLGKVPGQTDDPDDMLVENYTMMSALDQLVNGDQENFPSTSTSEWSSSATEGLLWTQSDLQKLKDGLQLY